MPNANISKEVRKAAYRRDHYRCALCDSTDGLQVHHAIHRSVGGASSLHNLITLCWRCHALCHGVNTLGDAITPEEQEQLCIEYLADYYAPDWNPWQRYHGEQF